MNRMGAGGNPLFVPSQRKTTPVVTTRPAVSTGANAGSSMDKDDLESLPVLWARLQFDGSCEKPSTT